MEVLLILKPVLIKFHWCFESGLRRFEGSFKCNFKCFNDTLKPFQGPFKRKFKVVSIVFQEYFKGEKKVSKEL